MKRAAQRIPWPAGFKSRILATPIKSSTWAQLVAWHHSQWADLINADSVPDTPRTREVLQIVARVVGYTDPVFPDDHAPRSTAPQPTTLDGSAR